MIVTLAAVLAALCAGVVAWRAARARDRALAAERRMRRLAVHDQHVAIALLDRDLRVVELEGEALECSGWARDEFLGNVLPQALDTERGKPLIALVEKALAGRPGTFETESSRREGAWFRMDVLPFAEGREITHVAVLMRDIGSERALRRSLEKQQIFLQAVLNELGDRVRVADADGRLHAFDGSTVDDDLHPLEWAEHFGLHHLDGRPFGPHETPLLRALRGEPVEPVEVLVDTDAGRRTLLASGGPVTGPDGARLGAVIVNADLTDFRDAEGRLRRSEERHRRVVESVSDCVFETDASGRWTHLTEAWTAATGFDVDACLDRPVWDFVHPDDRAEHARAFAPMMGGERVALRHSHRYLTAAGAERWGEVQVRAISGWDGLPTGFVGVMRDVTDERRAAQHVAAEQGVMRALTTMQSLEDAGPVLLDVLGRELGWDGAELWRMGDDERLHRSAAWTADAGGLERFIRAGDWLSYEVGDGLPGMSWMSRVPLWRADIAVDGGLVRREEALAEGVRSTVALPLRANGAPEGVIVLVSCTPREPEHGLTRLLEAIGGQVSQFLQRREAEARVLAQAADLRTLSNVAHELAVENDLFAARNTLCRAVRDVTGSVSVALLEPSGRDALTVSAAVGAAVLRMSVAIDARAVTSEAYLTGELIHVADVLSDARASSCQAVAGAASAAWVPVVRDGRAVGVLAVGWASHRASLSDRDAELLRLLAAEAAITIHRTDLLARLQSTARTDPLTGLPNRRVWDEDLDRELARARRHGGSLCLAMLDLDKFKTYNDTFGHQAGDELLEAAACAWRPELRTTDTLARYGGEEFAVLLPHSDIEGARGVVERLLAVVPFDQTASAGIALWDGTETAEELLARADAALYDAKHAGRARALIAA
ncbi:diguanylate cyclase [Solirubrobacter sp. CPCC 204708]|uniref:Diguanylate cyclase n=1 Tax=Solirubrobacter deserti TaxID=2282478 RepID=A0ABT4RR79_9ACTN|nr:diguanylate cyclase [Solirubrobacter deserti]MBE2314852.1 diguanylate cyclase [Solirubrobacter deserti]MDA0141079.1 diguanylate cyclase [Solirubrobacter deserti]